jgi:hypothetical protein
VAARARDVTIHGSAVCSNCVDSTPLKECS